MTKVICRFFIVCQSQSQSRYIWEGVVFREITSIRLSFSISLSVCQLIYVLFCKFFNFFPYLLLVNSRCAIRLLPAKARNSWTSFLCCCWFFFSWRILPACSYFSRSYVKFARYYQAGWLYILWFDFSIQIYFILIVMNHSRICYRDQLVLGLAQGNNGSPQTGFKLTPWLAILRLHVDALTTQWNCPFIFLI